MFKIVLYGLAGYGGYMLYQQYISKEITIVRNEVVSDIEPIIGQPDY